MIERIAEASPLLSPRPSSPRQDYFPPQTPTSDLPVPCPSGSTTREYERSLVGFYLYSIASEVWVITTGTLFLPVVLETYARSQGRLSPDYSLPCPSTVSTQDEIVGRCAVKILFSWVDTASFSLIVYSLSVALQALTVISIGALADDPVLRHRFLLSFATIGSLASFAFVLLPSTSIFWWMCALFAIVANICFGATGVCLNSHLPTLARLSPIVSTAQESLQTSLDNYHSLLLLSQQRKEQSNSPASPPSNLEHDDSDLSEAARSFSLATSHYALVKSQETSKISSRAIAVGYGVGIAVLIGLLPLVNYLGKGEGDETWPLRVAIGVSAVGWFVGSIIASRFLEPPPPPLNPTRRPTRRRSGSGGREYETTTKMVLESVKKSWRELGKTLREWRKLPNTFVYLSAWFLLSDSFATLTSTAMLFAKTTLHLPTSSLIVVAILTPFSGIVGSLLFPSLQSHHLLPSSSLSVLFLLVCVSSLIPLWGILSLNSSIQLYALAILFGTLYGSFQSYSRTVFSELVPKSQAGRWFGLYSITDKSSSFLGPGLVSIITIKTGEIRNGFWLILGFFLMSLPILKRVDMEKGTKDAETFEAELEELQRLKGRISFDAHDGEDEEEGVEGLSR
ncbi:Atg22p [Sporobolomyces salmoneus]|uniref:Atg22p n=1 Tax=Sporobolomyces salmoneus TaxID=183962 RepID=UPI003180668F